MNITRNFFDKKGVKVTLKLGMMFVLTLLLLVPKFMILELVRERRYRNEAIKEEISKKWATKQTLIGPILKIPYITKEVITTNTKNKQQKQKNQQNIISTVKKWAYFLPKDLNINGDVKTQKLHRSIYDVIVYESKLHISGQFSSKLIKDWAKSKQNALLEEAQIIFAISDQIGMKKIPKLIWNNNIVECTPGVFDIRFTYQDFKNTHYISSITPNTTNGLSATIDIDFSKQNTYSLSLNLNGSEVMSFTPLGKTTSISLNSDWGSPSFNGNFLPIPDSKEISKDGFKVKWEVTEFNRSFPAHFERKNIFSVVNEQFGVYFKQEADYYQKSERSVKYMILLIILMFLAFFLTEIIRKLRIHLFQYIMVGIAISIFFLLLLALSEYIGFDISYLLAAVATIVLISLYSISFLQYKKNIFILILLQVLAFGYIYIITQMSEKALLFGAIGLFIITAVTMYITSKINWFEE